MPALLPRAPLLPVADVHLSDVGLAAANAKIGVQFARDAELRRSPRISMSFVVEVSRLGWFRGVGATDLAAKRGS